MVQYTEQSDFLFNRSAVRYRAALARRNDFEIIKDFRPTRQVVAWKLTHRMNFVGGRGCYSGNWDDVKDCYAEAGGFDTLTPGYLFPSWEPVSVATPTPTGSMTLHWENIYSLLIMGIGDGTDVSLIKETSATNPAPAAISFNPTTTSHITSLSKGVINAGTASGQRLIIGLSEDPALVMDSDLSTTAAMHANTEDLYWFCQTSLPYSDTAVGGFTEIFQATNTIYKRSTADGVATAPTASNFTNVPAGGYLIKPGEFALPDTPNRVWVWIPNDSKPAGGLTFGAETLGQVHWVANDASDMGVFRFEAMPLGVYQVCHWRNGLVAHNSKRIVWKNGVDDEQDLGILQSVFDCANAATSSDGFLIGIPKVNTNFRTVVRNIAVKNGVLWAEVEHYPSSGTDGYMIRWQYTDAGWHPVQRVTRTQATAVAMVMGAGGSPISDNTGAIYAWNQTGGSPNNWYYWLTPQPGITEYFGEALNGLTHEANDYSFLWLPKIALPAPANNGVSVVSSFALDGIITMSSFNGSSNGFNVRAMPQTAIGTYVAAETTVPLANAYFGGTTFGVDRLRYYKKFPDNTESWRELMLKLGFVPSAVSDRAYISELQVCGLTFLDGRVRKPSEVWGTVDAIP